MFVVNIELELNFIDGFGLAHYKKFGSYVL